MPKAKTKDGVPKSDAILTNDGWTKADCYRILKADLPDSLDDCWSACNGVDGFGHDDPEIDAARKRHGECLEGVPGTPRLILYRWRKESALSAKLWYLRTVTEDDNLNTMWAAFTRALLVCKHSYMSCVFDAELYDWDPSGKHPNERYEFSIEACGLYDKLKYLKSAMDEFVTHFEEFQKVRPE
jgi:hypothetical protein